MDFNNTVTLPTPESTVQISSEALLEMPCEPTLFVRYGGILEQFALFGRQNLGRIPKDDDNYICIPNPFVSREHGFFETQGIQVNYTASSATNGIFLNGVRIMPGKTVSLNSGDKLTIPTDSDGSSDKDILMVCALTQGEYAFWNSLMESQFDPLTGLPTRKLFTEWFGSATGSGNRRELRLFILDIDKFKQINDGYGHDSGDSALKLLANELKSTADNIYHVCRWGGDEFVGVMRGDTASAVERLKAMSRRISMQKVDDRFNMTISVGLCTVTVGTSESLEALLKKADAALYRSKGEGRNRVSVYEES